jgi:prepilin signal peptidase PulO-like enzyme (type II secretory pathway)
MLLLLGRDQTCDSPVFMRQKFVELHLLVLALTLLYLMLFFLLESGAFIGVLREHRHG